LKILQENTVNNSAHKFHKWNKMLQFLERQINRELNHSLKPKKEGEGGVGGGEGRGRGEK
jgi:hypothetical protein